MIIWTLIVGLGIPTAIGAILVRLIEPVQSVLTLHERLAIGAVLGPLAFWTIGFLLHTIAGVPLSALSLWLIALVLISAGIAVLYKQHKKLTFRFTTPDMQRSFGGIELFLLLVIAGKIILVGAQLLSNLPFHDDVVRNWSLRGKQLYYEQQLPDFDASIPSEDIGLLSYPWGVPFYKAWVAYNAADWSHTTTSAIHFWWYLSLIVLVGSFTTRLTSKRWGLIAMYILTSLPLINIHGAISYAETLVANLVVIAAMSLIFARESDEDESRFWLLLTILTIGLGVHTKNEWIVIFTPLLSLCLILFGRNTSAYRLNKKNLLIWTGAAIALAVVPWLLFKLNNGLTFGNGKSIQSLAISWQDGALYSYFFMMFGETSWLLLYPVFVVSLILGGRFVLKSNWLIPLIVVLGVMFGHLAIFCFTPLSVEATGQTGAARGMLHYTPLVVMLVTAIWYRLAASFAPARSAE